MKAGYVSAEALRLPFGGDAPIARHCSYQGAKKAEERCARQALALLAVYREHGPLTDAEAAYRLGVERTTINARRNELVAQGHVSARGTRKNDKTNINNTVWGLS
jgi:predicted HTH transcriptional regulator